MSYRSVTGWAINQSRGRISVDVLRTDDEPNVHRLRVSARGAGAVELALGCAIDEHFCGLGEQFSQVDKRGRIIDGWLGVSVNQAAAHTYGLDGGYKLAALWYSSAGYAAFTPTTRRFRLDLAALDPLSVRLQVPGEELELTVVEGPPLAAIEVVTRLTGRPPLAPPWVYGVWRSSRGGHDAVIDDARRSREAGLPGSAMWVDAHYEERSNSGFRAAGSYPLGEYPDIAATASGLRGVGFTPLTYVNPYVYRNTPAAADAEAEDVLIKDASGSVIRAPMLHPFEGDAFGLVEEMGVHSHAEAVSFIDFTNPAGMAWFKENLRRALVDEGFDGWMEDFGEGVPPGAVLHDGSTAETAHNRWPLLYRQATAEAIAEHKPDAAGFARGYWLGAQRYAKVFWPGDQARDWSPDVGIGCIVAAGISAGLMGIAAWGPDIAANVGYPGIAPFGQGAQDEELWMRWCELGAMTPVMREHLGFFNPTPVDVWSSEATRACWRRSAGWHLRHFPHLYTLAHEASQLGVPILRGLMLHFPEDPLAWTLTQQFMLGDALLCAPVVQPGVTQQRVYVPTGSWIGTGDGALLQGPAWHVVPADLDSWPVLQRAGTAVALLAEGPQHLNDPRYAAGHFDLEVRATPGEDQRALFDGTELRLDGERLTVLSPRPRRVFVATPNGRRFATGTGTRVDLALR